MYVRVRACACVCVCVRVCVRERERNTHTHTRDKERGGTKAKACCSTGNPTKASTRVTSASSKQEHNKRMSRSSVDSCGLTDKSGASLNLALVNVQNTRVLVRPLLRLLVQVDQLHSKHERTSGEGAVSDQLTHAHVLLSEGKGAHTHTQNRNSRAHAQAHTHTHRHPPPCSSFRPRMLGCAAPAWRQASSVHCR